MVKIAKKKNISCLHDSSIGHVFALQARGPAVDLVSVYRKLVAFLQSLSQGGRDRRPLRFSGRPAYPTWGLPGRDALCHRTAWIVLRDQISKFALWPDPACIHVHLCRIAHIAKEVLYT